MGEERKFSRRDYAAPFGRYQSGNELGAPNGTSNQVLVGREEQRAYFIELLLRMGQRGAYLVTGQRGVGKTSFVRYCLAEYKEEVFERFLRSSVGRVVFWDHVGVLLLAFCIIFVLLMVSELMEVITFSTGWGKGDDPNILFGLVIIPLALICLYPLLYARGVLEKVIETGRRFKGRASGFIATVGTLGLAGLTFFQGPFGSPALSTSRLFLAICGIYLWVQGTSFELPRKEASKWVHRWNDYAPWLIVPFALACVFLGTTITTFAPEIGISGVKVQDILISGTDREYYGNLLWGAMLLGGGSLLRGVYLARVLPPGGGRPPQRWYVAAGLVVMAVAGSLFLWMIDHKKASGLSLAAAGLCLALVFFIFFMSALLWGGIQRGPSWPSFRPRPREVLAAKAFLSVIVTLQLIHPVFDKWTPAHRSPDREATRESDPPRRRPPTPLAKISSLSEIEQDFLKQAERKTDERAQEERWLSRLEDRRDIAAFQHQESRRGILEGQIAASEERIRILTEEVEVLSKKAALNSQRRDSAVFYGRTEELSWVLTLLLALVVLYFMEYEWIVRPFTREREDGALDRVEQRAAWEDQQPKDSSYGREGHRELARMTLPWMLYDRWLPVLTVSVNLGFEKLDHRKVVHAMLAGLRDQYHRSFCAWNSGIANLGRLFGILILMMLVTLAGERWFSMPPIDLDGAEGETSFSAKGYEQICGLFRGRQMGPGMANWICKLAWGDSIVHILYYNLLDSSSDLPYSERDLHLLFQVFPYAEKEWPPGERAPFLEDGIQLRVYHIVLFLIFFLVGKWLLSRLPIFPYRELLQRIDDTMDSLASRTSVTSSMGRWKPAQWLQGFFMDERVRQTEQDPVDPRTVEFVFLQILRDVQGSSIQLPGGRNQKVSLPTPEVTFVLDELDKIGTRVDPDEAGSSGGAQQAEIINAERRRSMELHRLLADMKNLLSAAPARFIFVGGRNLHDEWLADQTARQPLLTNIFKAEVYLPSLLTDSGDLEKNAEPRLQDQVRRYVLNQKKRAEDLYGRAWRNRWLPMLGLPLEHREGESFLQSERSGASLQSLKIFDTEGEAAICFPGDKDLEEDFIRFLTYRSMGNSKKLREMLAAFVRPAGRVVSNGRRRWDEFRDCDHVLLFGDTERFRIQLLARVYRHLTTYFEQGLVRRDDKPAASILYLTDFLFKFHRRAFSWSNLERVDELVHIHRAPDLREILEAIVVQWSERFLHPIRNGMYDFRFRSDMAREIEYVSRQSAEEMAAFNFTLDESQMLKAAYETNIARLESGKELQDLVAGLGELHEFDQEYETARLYYRRAISLLDAELEDVVGNGILDSKTPRIEIIGGLPKGQENARRYMTWGIARLRLMLQIGMTFEHSRNLERAEMEYQNARTLARSLLLAMLDDKGRERALDLGIQQAREATGDDRLHALKHLNILFQPLFAEIWVAEKLAGGVDTSTSLAEKELWQLRGSLPFVSTPQFAISESPTEVQGSNFALIATELHNKTGDLYFIKGRQLPVIRRTEDIKEQFWAKAGSEGLEGYLLRAHYHYAVGLHEVRRFVTHRRLSSQHKLNLGPASPTIVPGGWPDFVFRAAGGAFNDLAECLLGRTSLLALLRQWMAASEIQQGASVEVDVERFVEVCTRWLEGEGTDQEATDLLPLKCDNSRLPELGPMSNWVGRWCNRRFLNDPRLIHFESTPGDGTISTLAASLGFSFVGARYLERGGYLEDSGREMIKVCDTVSHCLWWGLTIRQLAQQGLCGDALQKEKFVCWEYLFEVALYALWRADRLFRRSRRANEGDGPYFVGKGIPVAALTQACALGLAADRWGASSQVKDEVGKILLAWTGTKLETTVGLRRLLEESLVRHSYPMINRLHTLRILIDDTVIGGEIGEEPEKTPGERIIRWTEELLDLEASLNAPLHFTPLYSGTTCALVYLSSQDLQIPKIGEAAERELRARLQKVGNAAERALLASQEMYSMRRAFYESISDLYYLYDDFNDRQLHFNHAIQMAGAELASLLRYQLAGVTEGLPAEAAGQGDSLSNPSDLLGGLMPSRQTISDLPAGNESSPA